MTRRPLNDEDRKLWRHVTRDVKKLNADPAEADSFLQHMQNTAPPSSARRRLLNSTELSNRQAALNPKPVAFSTTGKVQPADHNWGQKLRRGKAPIEGTIDLHGMTRHQAYQALQRYVARARGLDKRVILVITGKGGPKVDYDQMSYADFEYRRGILKDQVPGWLSHGDLADQVVSYYPARRQDGGEGALYVVLKRRLTTQKDYPS